MKILLYAYGNPGRQDDGLGNVFIEEMKKWVKQNNLEGFSFDSNYQLNIEDALEISKHDVVVFIDASTEDIEDFCMSKVDATAKVTFTTHAASPGYVVDLCKQLYKKSPPTYLLHIKGYDWGLAEGLSDKANENLEKAVSYLENMLLKPESMLDPDVKLKDCIDK